MGEGTIRTLGLRLDATGFISGGAVARRELSGISSEAANTERRVLSLAGVVRGGFDSVGASARSIGADLVRLGAGFGAAFTSFEGIQKFIHETSEAQHATAQLEAAIRSTGGAAGRTVEQMEALAESLQRTSTFTDDQIEKSEGLLATFDKIKGENFDRAVRDIADVAERLGGLESASIQVGKALQDPEQGLMALRRAGISFSEAQQQVIKHLFETGQAAEAQRLILKELEHEFGGSAEAARNTLGGALAGLKHDFDDLFKAKAGGTSGLVDAIKTLDSAVVALRPHMGQLVTAAEAVGAVFVGRWLAGGIESLAALTRGFVLARAESAAYIENAVRVAAAEAERTAVLARQAAIERALAAERAQAAVVDGVALTERAAAINAIAAANTRLAVTSEAAAVAEAELAAATAATTLAARAGAATTSLFSGALALVGGPIGAAVIATIGLVTYALHRHSEAQRQAKEDVDNYTRSLDGLTAGAREAQQATLQLAKAQEEAYLKGLERQRDTTPRGAVDPMSGYGADAAAASDDLDARIKTAQASVAALDQMLTAGAHAVAAAKAQELAVTSDLISEREVDLRKLTALNAAYGQSADKIAVLTIQLDAEIQKTKDLKDVHDEASRKRISQLDDEIAQQKIAAYYNAAVQQDREAGLASIQKEADALRENYNATQDLLRASGQAAALAKAEGVGREYLQHQITAENDAIAAQRTLSGQALQDRLKAIDTIHKESDATSALVAARQDLLDLAKKIHAAPLPADPQAAGIEKAYSDAKQAREAFREQVVRGIADDLSNAIANGFHDGLKSAENFANSVLGLFETMAARAATLKLGQVVFGGGGLGRTAEEEAAYHTKPVGGGPTAFDRDQLSTFAVTAGAVIGVANALNTLTGAARNSAAAIQAMGEAYTHFVTSTQPAIEALQAQLNGRPIDSQLQQIDALRKQVEQDLAGKRLEGERESALRQLDALEAQRIKQLQEEAAAVRATTAQGYNVRLQRAQGNTQGANDAEFAYAQAKELTDFLHEFGLKQPELFAQLTAVLDAEKAAYEQAKKDADAAKALANTRAVEDAKLGESAALANGKNGTQDARDVAAMQSLILQHQREIADLEAQSASAELLAATKAKDAAEEAALAWQQAVAAIQQASSDLSQQFSVFGTNPQDQLATVSQLYGFQGLTLDQVLAKYTPVDVNNPGGLTDAQRELNREIADFVKYFNAAQQGQQQTGGGLSGSVASAGGERNAIANAVEGIDRQTSLRLADIESSQLTELRFIRQDVHTLAGGALLRPNLGGAELSNFLRSIEPIPGAPPVPASQSAPRTVASVSAGGVTFNFSPTINIPVGTGAALPKELRAALLQSMRDPAFRHELEEAMYDVVRAAQKKAGDPTIPA